jgi:hypothetical protein
LFIVVLYLDTAILPGNQQTPENVLQPYLQRLHSSPLFASYRISNAISPCTTSHSSVVLLEPYRGNELLTEGMDWEAEQGEKAYLSVIGRADGDRDFFEKNEGEGEEEDLDL